MSKLSKEEQIKEQYRKKFTEIGTSTRPTNRVRAEAAIRALYDHEKVAFPTNVFWGQGPIEGAKLVCQAKGLPVTQENIRLQAEKAEFGSFQAYWVSTYSYIANEQEKDKNYPIIKIGEDICEELGVYWCYPDFTVLTEKPRVLVTNAEGRLHNETGPSLVYPNGEKFFHLDGVNMLNEVNLALEVKKRKNEGK
jgi:hypothetical protein